MKSMMSMLFQSPGVLSILSHMHLYPVLETAHSAAPIKKRKKNPKGLSVQVDIPYDEVTCLYNKAIANASIENYKKKFDYYKTYLRQMIPSAEEDRYDRIVASLKPVRLEVEGRMDRPYSQEVLLVHRLIGENKYVSKNTKRPGLIVKLFHTHFYDKDVFVKVYLYDPQCPSYNYSFTENFKNEVIFQSYAKQLNATIDFISPELYSWGRIDKFMFDDDDNDYEFECLFMIMEYLPFVTLKEAVYSTDHMRHIYERVEQIDTELSSHLLHHNDLHRGNIMVSDRLASNKSPYPEIVIFDFGEASLGPTKPIFQRGIK